MVLAGCSLIPAYERPAAPVPAVYPGAQPASSAQSPASTLAWQDFFTDPRLAKLIETALANNRDLRVSVLNIEQARAQFQIQRAAQFPALDLTASGSRSSPNALQAIGVGGSVASSYSVNLGITAWELDFFGRVASLKEQALAQYLATEESRKAAQISLIGAVASGWLTLIADDQLLELTRQTLVTREESQKLTRMRFDSGVVSRSTSAWPTRWPSPRVRPTPSSSACACRTRTHWPCCSARRCRLRPPKAAAVSMRSRRCRTCRPACPPTCWASGPTSVPPNSS